MSTATLDKPNTALASLYGNSADPQPTPEPSRRANPETWGLERTSSLVKLILTPLPPLAELLNAAATAALRRKISDVWRHLEYQQELLIMDHLGYADEWDPVHWSEIPGQLNEYKAETMFDPATYAPCSQKQLSRLVAASRISEYRDRMQNRIEGYVNLRNQLYGLGQQADPEQSCPEIQSRIAGITAQVVLEPVETEGEKADPAYYRRAEQKLAAKAALAVAAARGINK